MAVIALSDAHGKFMGLSAHWHNAVFFGEVDIGCTYALGPQHVCAAEPAVGFYQLFNRQLLGLSREPTTQAKFAEVANVILSGDQPSDFLIRLLLKRVQQRVVIILHPEVDFIDDGQYRNLVHRTTQPGSTSLNSQTARGIGGNGEILISGLPKPQIIHIAAFYPADGVDVLQLFFCETQGTVGLQLLFDFLHHFRCEENILVAAVKDPGGFIAAELMIDALAHAEFVHVNFQKTGNDRIKFYVSVSF